MRFIDLIRGHRGVPKHRSGQDLLAGFALGLLSVFTGGGFFFAFLVGAALSFASRNLFSPLTPGGGGDADARSRLQGANAPAQFVFGRTRCTGQLVWYRANKRFFTQVFVISEGPTVGFAGTVWLNGERYVLEDRGGGLWSGYKALKADRGYDFDRDGNSIIRSTVGFRSDSERRQDCIYVRHFPTANGISALPIRRLAGQPGDGPAWTSNHKLSGVSYVMLTVLNGPRDDTSRTRFWPFRGIPRAEFLWWGMKFSVPNARGEHGPVEWTQNAAKIRYWWLRNRRGVSDSEIDLTELQEAIRICDEQINIRNAGQDFNVGRYTINGVISSADTPTRVEADMDVAMSGHCVLWDGKFLIRPGAERAPDAEIYEDDVIEAPTLAPSGSFDSRINEMVFELPVSRPDFFSPTTVTVNDEEAEMAAGQRLTQSAKHARFIDEPVRARNILLGYLSEQRAPLGVQIVVRPRAHASWELGVLRPGDKVRLHLPRLGLDPADFAVARAEMRPDFAVLLDLQEWPADRFTDRLLPYESGQADEPAMPPPDPPNPTGVTAEIEVVEGGALRLEVNWDASDFEVEVVLGVTIADAEDDEADYERIRGTFVSAAETSVAFGVTEEELARGPHVRVQAVSTRGGLSDWVIVVPSHELVAITVSGDPATLTDDGVEWDVEIGPPGRAARSFGVVYRTDGPVTDDNYAMSPYAPQQTWTALPATLNADGTLTQRGRINFPVPVASGTFYLGVRLTGPAGAVSTVLPSGPHMVV